MRTLYFCPVVSFYLLFFIPCLISAAADCMSTILAHMAWPYCKFRMQVWNVLHAARWKYLKYKNDAKKLPSVHHPTTSSGYIFATKARIDIRKKNLLSSNISPTCPYNTVSVGWLAAEIVSLVWGTPANFNGFHVLAALLHIQTAAHLYSAGWPSHWALAHISSWISLSLSLKTEW